MQNEKLNKNESKTWHELLYHNKTILYNITGGKKILTGIVAGAPKTLDPRGQSNRFWPPTFSGSVKREQLLKQLALSDANSHRNSRQTEDRTPAKSAVSPFLART